MDLTTVLNNLGLNEKEARVYLAALELGEAPASHLALRAKLNRVSTYDILERLIQRGFMSTRVSQNTKTFAPTDPDLIRDDFRKKYLDFKQALPDLRRLHGKTSHPRVRYYEGLEAIKKVYAETLSAKTEILNYADSKTIREYWPSYDADYVQERIRRKIKLRGIAPMDDHGRAVQAKDAQSFREIRLVAPDAYAFNNEINIYDDKVSIISFGKDALIGMIIESPEIANTQRAIFMMAWAFASTNLASPMDAPVHRPPQTAKARLRSTEDQ